MNLRSRLLLIPSIALTTAFVAPAALTEVGLGSLPLAEAESLAQGVPAPSDAVTEVARQRYQEGVKAFDAGRYEEARAAFYQAYALKRAPAILLNIGLSELKSNHPEDAGNHFQQFLREAPTATAAQKATADKGIADAKKKAGVVVVVVDATGADISIDGLTVGKSPLLDPVFVKGGKHTIFASFQGRLATSVIEVNVGATVMANLATAGVATPPAPPVPGPAVPPVPGPAVPPTPGPGVPPTPGPGVPGPGVPGPGAPGPGVPGPGVPPAPGPGPGPSPPAGPAQPYNPNQPIGPTPYPGYGGVGPVGPGPDQSSTREPFLQWYKHKPIAWVGTGVAGLGLLGGIIFSIGASSASGDANTLVGEITQKRSDFILNPDGRTNVCGDRDTGVGAVPAFASKCELLRQNMSLYNTQVALAATSWALFGVGAVGTGVYTYLDWYAKKRNPTAASGAPARLEKGRAIDPKLLAVTPYVSPTQTGLGVAGTF